MELTVTLSFFHTPVALVEPDARAIFRLEFSRLKRVRRTRASTIQLASCPLTTTSLSSLAHCHHVGTTTGRVLTATGHTHRSSLSSTSRQATPSPPPSDRPTSAPPRFP